MSTSSVLVMPTVNEINPEFIRTWAGQADTILVIDDANKGYKFDHPKAVSFDHAAQRDYVGDTLWPYVPHHSKSCAQFGSYYAYREGYDIILFLDDDCKVYSNGYDMVGLVGSHGTFLEWMGRDPMSWHDPIADGDVYARGYPYEYRNRTKCQGTWGISSGKLHAVMSLWDGTWDVNCIDKIAGVKHIGQLPRKRGLYTTSAFFPFSGMAMGITREALPAYIWAPAMELLPDMRINRHEDIWAGFILELIAQVKGDLIGICEPQVLHTKAGYNQLNAVEEMFEIAFATRFYDILYNCINISNTMDYIENTAILGQELSPGRGGPREPGLLYDYLTYYGQYIEVWTNAFGGCQ